MCNNVVLVLLYLSQLWFVLPPCFAIDATWNDCLWYDMPGKMSYRNVLLIIRPMCTLLASYISNELDKTMCRAILFCCNRWLLCYGSKLQLFIHWREFFSAAGWNPALHLSTGVHMCFPWWKFHNTSWDSQFSCGCCWIRITTSLQCYHWHTFTWRNSLYCSRMLWNYWNFACIQSELHHWWEINCHIVVT